MLVCGVWIDICLLSSELKQLQLPVKNKTRSKLHVQNWGVSLKKLMWNRNTPIGIFSLRHICILPCVGRFQPFTCLHFLVFLTQHRLCASELQQLSWFRPLPFAHNAPLGNSLKTLKVAVHVWKPLYLATIAFRKETESSHGKFGPQSRQDWSRGACC